MVSPPSPTPSASPAAVALQGMRPAATYPNTVSYNATITACAEDFVGAKSVTERLETRRFGLRCPTYRGPKMTEKVRRNTDSVLGFGILVM